METAAESFFPEIESRLTDLAEPLAEPKDGDWLAEHQEKGQTFRQYLSADPVRRSGELHTLYLCLVGDFDEAQQRIVDRTQEYLGLFFDVPVCIHRRVPLSDIPARARRKHPRWGVKQLLTAFILREVLEPDACWRSPSRCEPAKAPIHHPAALVFSATGS